MRRKPRTDFGRRVRIASGAVLLGCIAIAPLMILGMVSAFPDGRPFPAPPTSSVVLGQCSALLWIYLVAHYPKWHWTMHWVAASLLLFVAVAYPFSWPIDLPVQWIGFAILLNQIFGLVSGWSYTKLLQRFGL